MIFLLGGILNQGYSGAEVLAFVLAYIFAVAIAFGVHEFSHAFAAYKLGDPTAKALGRLTLNPLKHLDAFGIIGFLFVGFGWAKPVPYNPMNFKKFRRDTFIVSISGVVANIVLAFVLSGAFYFFFINCASFNASGALHYSNSLMFFIHFFLEYSVIINIALFIFNLLPIYPLDGFKALSVIVKPNNKFLEFMFRYGSFIMLLIIITPVFDWLYSIVTDEILGVFFKFWGLFV